MLSLFNIGEKQKKNEKHCSSSSKCIEMTMESSFATKTKRMSNQTAKGIKRTHNIRVNIKYLKTTWLLVHDLRCS